MEYMDFSSLPEALSAKHISAILGISKQAAYCLLHSRFRTYHVDGRADQ